VSDIFTSQHVSSSTLLDMVVFEIGTHRPRVPYQTAFEILNGVRMAAKMAMAEDGNPVTAWRQMAEINADRDKPIPHRGFRRSTEVSNVGTWSVRFEGVLVVLVFDELTAKIHYADALTWYTGLRISARQAKAWAGDTSRTLRGVAHLTDAEANDKKGFG
jgi:hypothetical protein